MSLDGRKSLRDDEKGSESLTAREIRRLVYVLAVDPAKKGKSRREISAGAFPNFKKLALNASQRSGPFLVAEKPKPRGRKGTSYNHELEPPMSVPEIIEELEILTRNWDLDNQTIVTLVVVDGRSWGEAAAAVGCSKRRVGQVMDRVKEHFEGVL